MVLQRWQTVYMFIAVVLLGLSTFMAVADVNMVKDSVESLSLTSLFNGQAVEFQSTYAYFLLCGVTALMTLVNIFKFKVLKFQKTLCSVGMLLIVAAYVVLGCAVAMADEVSMHWNLISLAPAFALICLLMAKSRIIKDYKLIHAADRLR